MGCLCLLGSCNLSASVRYIAGMLSALCGHAMPSGGHAMLSL